MKQYGKESNRSTCSSPSSSGSCPASPFPWMGISIVAAFPRIPSVMAREGIGVKVSTPAPCKDQHRHFWKLASTPERKVSPTISEILEVALRLEYSGVGPLLLSSHGYVFLPSKVRIFPHSHPGPRCLLMNPQPHPGSGDHSCIKSFNRHLLSAYYVSCVI